MPLTALSPPTTTAESLHLLASIVEGSTNAIVSTTLDGIVTSWNPAAEQLLGYTSREMIGQSFSICVPADRMEEFLAHKRIVAGGGRADTETIRLHKDGRRIEVCRSVWPIQDSDGTLTGISAVFRDISEKRTSEEKVRRSRALLEQITESMNAVLWVTEPAARRVSYVSPAFEKVWGRSCASLYENRSVWVQSIHPEDRERALAVNREQIKGSQLANEYRIVRADGTIRFIRDRAFPVAGEDGKVTRFAGLAEDVTAEVKSREALERSELRFEKLVESGLIGIVQGDTTGRLLGANATSLAMFGYSDEELSAGLLRWDTMIAPGYEQTASDVLEQLRVAGRAAQVEMAFVRKDGSLLHTLMGLASLDASGSTVIGFMLDLTERKQIEEKLRDSEEKFHQFAAGLREVLWLLDAKTLQILFVSPAYEQIWKQTCEFLYRHPHAWMDAIHPEDRPQAEAVFGRQLQGENVDNEYRIVQPGGEVRWIRGRAFPIRDDAGKIVRLAGVAEDITEWKRYEASLLHQALHDQLTDLPNRRLLLTELTAAIERQRETLDSLAVFFIDLEHFKIVNDSLGHAAGDQLLNEAAVRLRRITRETDMLARVGGDEFALAAGGFSNREQARRLGRKLLDCLEAPFTLEGREIFIGATLGISLFPGDGNEPEVLLRSAAAAAQQGRRIGRGLVTFFSEKFAEETRERLSMETRLRRALAQGEFRLQYQPQFTRDGERSFRSEALIRWYPADGEPVSPLNFIPLSEENGLIVPIGAWVLEEACRTAAAWQNGERRGMGVAVNVSTRQFADPEFVGLVAAVLKESGLAADLLELELTESVFIADLDESARKLRQLKALGVSIALDDFGTGYSSLSYLQNLPIDVIKIDRSFITETGRKQSGEAVLRCLIDLAHALGIRVIAEGVETAAQLDLLQRLGCDELQGFLLGRPAFETVPVPV